MATQTILSKRFKEKLELLQDRTQKSTKINLEIEYNQNEYMK
jgi:hypothetical protein